MPDLATASCLVTGATGFVGGELVRRLLQNGVAPARLRCLVRDPAAAVARGLPAASLCPGDVGDAAALRRAATGAQVVFHLAGTLKAARAGGYLPVNVAGTQNLVAALAAAAAPEVFVVHVSSLAAAGPSADGQGSDRPPDRCTPVSTYGESKRLGERAIVGACRRWTIVRLPVVYGAGDGATRLLFRQALAPLCPVPPRARPLSVIHVRDAVDALVAVAQHEPHGSVLPLEGPERTDTHALLRAIAAACGRSARLLPMPLGVAAVAARLSDVVAAWSGRSSFFNRDKIRELAAVGWVADAAAARRLLGWRARTSLAEGLVEVARAEGFGARANASG